MRRIITILLSCIFIFSVVAPCHALESRSEHEMILEKDFILGLDSINEPVDTDHGLSRSKFCKSLIGLCRDLGYTLPDASTCPILFTDTKDPDIALACMLGYVNGVGDNLFAPNRAVNFEQAATMMHRFLVASSRDYFEMSVQADEAVISAASDWAKDSLRYMIGIGVVANDIAPSATMSYEDCNVMMWRLYKKLGGKDVLVLEEAPDDLLVTLGFSVTADEIESEEIITKARAFESIIYADFRIKVTDDEIDSTLRSSYLKDPNSTDLIDLASPMTEKEALLYLVRISSGTGGCGYVPFLINYEDSDIYGMAFEKGIIDSPESTNAEKAITKARFYEMLKRSLFVIHPHGNVGGMWYERMIDKF